MSSYLSKDREHLARQQRQRRARIVRIDYTPSAEALAAIDAKRGRHYPLNTNSGVIDAIVFEWAKLTGIKNQEVEAPMTSAKRPELSYPFRAGAYDFGADLPTWGAAWLAANKAKQSSRRVVCGARRHRDGQPCRARSEPGKRRCRFHGGRSTGSRTDAGKARAHENLKQNQRKSACARPGA